MQHAIESLSPGFTPGIFMALAGSHFIYIKEIPMGMEYTMETRAIGWGEKWYVFSMPHILVSFWRDMRDMKSRDGHGFCFRQWQCWNKSVVGEMASDRDAS
jgi:hypothetical protein